MATKPQTHVVVTPRGYACAESARFAAQYDELSRTLWQDLAGIGSAELSWQPAPGANTIGMLLAHMAIVEVFWIQRLGDGFDEAALRRLLDLGVDDDGMPCPPRGAPPVTLRGWKLADFRERHERARRFAKRALKRLPASELERRFTVRRRDGQRLRFNVRWVLYHLLEHFAGHYGQILALRHQYRDRRKPRR